MNEALKTQWIKMLELRQSASNGSDLSDDQRRVMHEERQLLDTLKQMESPRPAPASLQKRIEFRNYLAAYANGTRIDGAEREMNQELRLNDNNQVPLEALLPIEDRVDTATNVTAGTFAKNQQAIMPRIFEQTDAAWLGIRMPSVPAGTPVYPVMTGGTTASTKAANAAIDAAAATFTAKTVNPTRLSARYLFNLEGVAEIGRQLESSLRSDMRMVMGDALDEQIIAGDGTGANVSGVVSATTAPTAATAVATWASYRDLPIDALDGKLARTEGSARFLLGLDTYKHARKTYAVASVTTPENQDAIDAMRALGANVRSSVKIPDVASNKQDLIQVTEPAAAIAPIWQGLSIIRDPYSNAAKAQVSLTAHILFGFVIKRLDGWKRINIQVAS